MIDSNPSQDQYVAMVTLPWEPEGTAAADSAIGRLRESLLAGLATERGVHVETLMTVVGALAGFAAQQAVWDHIRRTGKPVPKDSFGVATVESGERYYFGDMINGYLVPEGARDWTLWGFVAAGAVQAGVRPEALPDYTDMFRHAAATIGTEAFGIPRVPEDHRPHLVPRAALETFWSRARSILAANGGPDVGRGVAVAHWPAVFALLGRQFIEMSKDVLDPTLSVRLIMESAIAMLKIDAETIPGLTESTEEA